MCYRRSKVYLSYHPPQVLYCTLTQKCFQRRQVINCCNFLIELIQMNFPITTVLMNIQSVLSVWPFLSLKTSWINPWTLITNPLIRINHKQATQIFHLNNCGNKVVQWLSHTLSFYPRPRTKQTEQMLFCSVLCVVSVCFDWRDVM